ARAPSPRAPAPRGGHAAPPERHAGRRPVRASLRNELESVGDVTRLPARRLDLRAQAIGLVEVARVARLPASLRELDDLRWSLRRVGKRSEPEDVQRSP